MEPKLSIYNGEAELIIIASEIYLINGISIVNSWLFAKGLYTPLSLKRLSFDLLCTNAFLVLYILAANFLYTFSFEASLKSTVSPFEKLTSYDL